jgi:hypothetical protein
MVAGALGRRVHTRAVGEKMTYSNLYVMLVGPPGSGKGIIEEVRAFWVGTDDPTGGKAFRVSPDSMTKASFVDELNKATVVHLPKVGPPDTRHELLVASEEFQVLLPAWDSGMVGTLNALWNNRDEHSETRRHGPVKELTIKKPYTNILAGVQPSYLAEHFTDATWETGFVRRVIMIYGADAPRKKLFERDKSVHRLRKNILGRLSHLSTLYGEAKWAPDASIKMNDWYMEGGHPVPDHSKLKWYNETRAEFIIKLSLISALSRTSELLIEVQDVERAMNWLFSAERYMPDVFRAMQGRSDAAILDELHYFMWNLWEKNGKKPIAGRLIYHFLSVRVPTEKIDRIVDVAERSNIIARLGGTPDDWIPRPRHQHGVE